MQVIGRHHSLRRQSSDLVHTLLVHVEDQLVVHLHNHVGVERAEPRLEVHHRYLDNVRRRPLHPGVERETLPQLADVLVRVPELRHVPATPEERRRIPEILRFLECALYELRYLRVALQVPLDVPLRLRRVHVPKSHRKPEARDAVQDAEVHHLRPAPELRRYALRPDIEDLGGRAGVNVLTAHERLHERRLSGYMGEYSELYLGVVGDDQLPARRGGERVPDTGAHLRADGDVLQVRRVAGDATRGCRGLVEGRMNATVFADEADQTIYVRALELGQLTVGDDSLRYRVLDGELLQNLGIGRVAGLGLSGGREAHLAEEDLPELLRGSDVEGMADLLENPGLQLLNPLFYLPADLLQCRDIRRHPDSLHLPQHVCERQLDVVVELRDRRLLQLLIELWRERVNQRRPPGRLSEVEIRHEGLDLCHPPLVRQSLEIVAPKPGLYKVSRQVRVEARPPHPELLGVMHLEGVVRYAGRKSYLLL